jgi:hypothetical protein
MRFILLSRIFMTHLTASLLSKKFEKQRELDLEAAYEAASKDKEREAEAKEWCRESTMIK